MVSSCTVSALTIRSNARTMFAASWDCSHSSRTARRRRKADIEVRSCGGGQSNRQAEGPIAAKYDYTDAEGELLYRCCRLEPKNFRQRRPGIWQLDLEAR